MELSHDLILGTDWINQIGGISIHPSTSSVIIEPFTDHQFHSPPETYRTDRAVIVPPLSLAFLPIPKQTDDKGFRHSQCLIVNRSFSANPGAEWVIPNSILTELGDHYYVSIFNLTRKPITVQSGQQVSWIELIEEAQWSVLGDNVEVGSVSREKFSTPEFLQQTGSKMGSVQSESLLDLEGRTSSFFFLTTVPRESQAANCEERDIYCRKKN